jgi:hypothetical protein
MRNSATATTAPIASAYRPSAPRTREETSLAGILDGTEGARALVPHNGPGIGEIMGFKAASAKITTALLDRPIRLLNSHCPKSRRNQLQNRSFRGTNQCLSNRGAMTGFSCSVRKLPFGRALLRNLCAIVRPRCDLLSPAV